MSKTGQVEQRAAIERVVELVEAAVVAAVEWGENTNAVRDDVIMNAMHDAEDAAVDAVRALWLPTQVEQRAAVERRIADIVFSWHVGKDLSRASAELAAEEILAALWLPTKQDVADERKAAFLAQQLAKLEGLAVLPHFVTRFEARADAWERQIGGSHD